MSEKKHLIALDCGNSSYRLVQGTYENGRLNTKVIAQEKNEMTLINGLYYWDLMKMYQFLVNHLKQHISEGGVIDAIGICTWGVDFAFYDKHGNDLGNALSYRNTLGHDILNRLTEDEKDQVFKKTGIYCDRINSVYLMKGLMEKMPEKASITEHLLMIPDIINYYLTGVMVNEPSELSTTQLMDSKTKSISHETCDFFNIPANWFSEIGEHGKVIGNVQSSVKEMIGAKNDIPVVCVPSHDTAAAIAAIPTEEDEFLFISTGTWALIGAELDEPVITNEVLKAGLTNEVGALNKITLLKNSTGMFILENMKKDYELAEGQTISWGDFVELASLEDLGVIIDVNHERLFNPLHMTDEICAILKESVAEKTFTINELLSIVYRSMARNYAKTLASIEQVTGKHFDKVYMVGGGTRNQQINQLTADISGKQVITCGEESTCLGNLGLQIKCFNPELSLRDIRKIIGDSINTVTYEGH